jgi:hypothetical protein
MIEPTTDKPDGKPRFYKRGHPTPEFQEFIEARSRGLSPSEVVQLMHQRGLSITKAVLGYSLLYDVGVREADEAVGSHALYRDDWEASKRFQEKLFDRMNRLMERLTRYRERQR